MRPLDINKTQEWLDVLHPYLRWLMLIIYSLMFLYINRMFLKDPALRKWLMASLEEKDGRASGKSLSGFIFSKLIAFATLTAIIYSPNHILPEFFLISLLTYIASLYGIKMATKSKYFNGTTDDTVSSTTTSTQSTSTEIVKEKKEATKEEKDKSEKKEDDIGVD